MKLALSGGAYEARSLIASAQRSCNLYAEPMPEAQGEPSRAAHYPTPGLRLLSSIGTGPIRAIRQVTTGGVYVVSGSTVYSVAADWTGTALGTITSGLRTPVSLTDNGLDLVIVDGTAGGWRVTLADNSFAAINDPTGSFAGADRVDYLDTFLLFNKPGTPQFCWTLSLSTAFDEFASDFANKQVYSDLLVTLIVTKREIYLLGERTTEVWYDTGATDTGAGSSQFAPVQGVFIDHGIVAKYSVANYDNGIFWLSRDRQGQGIVLEAADYKTKRVSTYAIEAEIAGYERIDDAVGYCYQLGGHAFYVLAFPHADKTWVYDITTGLWHEWVWIDTNGAEHRHRSNCHAAIAGVNVVGDWQNGNLYALDNRVFTDNGQPIKRVRSFPHVLADGKRVFYREFIADIETGTATGMLSDIPGSAERYSRTMTQINANLRGMVRSNTAWGFPINTDFHTLLMSFWMCGPVASPGGSSNPGIWPAFLSAEFFGFGPGMNSVVSGNPFICFTNPAIWGAAPYTGFFTGNIPPPQPTSPNGCLQHYLMSVDTHAQIVQVYINDQQQTVTGTWTGTPPFDFNVANTLNVWSWAVSGVISSGMFPGLGDAWISNTPAFVDLSVVENRRRFITRELNAVDLGDSGTRPFGYQPAMYMSVRPGGVAADILTNRGRGGGAWGYDQNPPTLQDAGACTLPPAPPPLPPPPVEDDLISLESSDDRGHSWGSPVSQPIGAAGEYRKSLLWRRLGMARDRVFRISWSTPMPTALQAAWITAEPGDGKGEKGS